MRLDNKAKADIRFFTYYLVNGTLHFDLLNNQLHINHIEYLEQNSKLFFESYCVFINHRLRTPDINPMNKRVAEYICKTIDPDNFRHLDNFENWEIDFAFEGNDFPNCFKDFAYRISFDKIPLLTATENLFKNSISYGATFWETVFVIWANNLEIENNKVINQEFAIERATQWYLDCEKVEDWEIELEM
jgi:hypothetical protein